MEPLSDRPWLKGWPSEVPASIEYPKEPLHWLLTRSARLFGDRAALIYEGSTYTFKELLDKAARVASSLTKLGVVKGSKVALFMLNSPDFVVCYYASLMAGATVVPLNPMLRAREATYMLEDAEVEVAIVDEETWSQLKGSAWRGKVIVAGEARPGGLSLETLATEGGLPPSVEIDPINDVAVIQYTAGTTAEPKGVMLTHFNLLSNAIAIAKVCLLREGEVQLGGLPLYHSYGMTNVMNASLYAGATVALMRRFDLEEALRTIERYKVNVWFGVPTMFIATVNHLRRCPHDLSSLRFCNSGGGPIAVSVIEEFEKVTGTLLMQGYGLTEASPVTHSNVPLKKYIKPGSVGRPLPDTEAMIVDLETGRGPLPPGSVGELVVKGPQVMKGYWKRPKETSEALRDGWLYTGDVAWMDEDGYFYVIDRKKDVIKCKGYSISPRELEDVLYQHPAVKECAVIGKPDPVAGEVPKAFVVLKEGYSVAHDELIKFVEERVAPYKRLREVEFRESLPKSHVGKVLRRLLREEELRRAR